MEQKEGWFDAEGWQIDDPNDQQVQNWWFPDPSVKPGEQPRPLRVVVGQDRSSSLDAWTKARDLWKHHSDEYGMDLSPERLGRYRVPSRWLWRGPSARCDSRTGPGRARKVFALASVPGAESPRHEPSILPFLGHRRGQTGDRSGPQDALESRAGPQAGRQGQCRPTVSRWARAMERGAPKQSRIPPIAPFGPDRGTDLRVRTRLPAHAGAGRSGRSRKSQRGGRTRAGGDPVPHLPLSRDAPSVATGRQRTSPASGARVPPRLRAHALSALLTRAQLAINEPAERLRAAAPAFLRPYLPEPFPNPEADPPTQTPQWSNDAQVDLNWYVAENLISPLRGLMDVADDRRFGPWVKPEVKETVRVQQGIQRRVQTPPSSGRSSN